MTTYQEIRGECIEAALSAIEYCGDPKGAIREHAYDDYGLRLTVEEISDSLMGAWAVWNGRRDDAGVPARYKGIEPWHYLAGDL